MAPHNALRLHVQLSYTAQASPSALRKSWSLFLTALGPHFLDIGEQRATRFVLS